MFKGFIVTVMVALVGVSAFAQGQQGVENDRSRVRRQVQITVMEGALVAAVRGGANDFVNQLTKTTQATAQGVLLGNPQATGFELADYGVFFHLRVPGMRGTFSWSYPVVAQRMRALQQPGQAQASNVADSGSPLPAPPPAAPVVDVGVLNDPEAAYVRSIRTAVIEAMLENSGALRVPQDQYLIVAARKDTGPNPLDPTDEVRTMYFTVKGADLEAYRQGHVTLEEARNLVKVIEY